MRDDASDGDRDGETRVAAVDDALSVLGNETRLRILLELAEEANERGMGTGLSFSELRDRVGVRDSGRFNYHLGELRDQFVTKSDEEYVARFPGLAVAAATYAGTYSDTDVSGETAADVDSQCPRRDCSRPVDAHYGRDGLFSGVWMECPEHGRFDQYPVPPGAREGRSLNDLVETAYRRAHAAIDLGRRGICLECWGAVSVTYPAEPDVDDEGLGEFVWTELSCERCWNRIHPPLRNVLVTHPLVTGLLYEHGYDTLDAARELTGDRDRIVFETDLRETDPAGARVRVTVDDETLAMTVDEHCSVLEHDRTGG